MLRGQLVGESLQQFVDRRRDTVQSPLHHDFALGTTA
jgi:hypothetical protein